MRGALVPHAPLLLPEVTTHPDGLSDIWDALGRIRIPTEAQVLVLTPHSAGFGCYTKAEGSLRGFGLDIAGAFPPGHGADLDLPPLEGLLDHGALVPLLLLGVTAPVSVVGLEDATDVTDLARSVRTLAAEKETFVLASAHTSTRLTERAPLPYSYDAVRLESRFITGVESDCAAARELADELRAVGNTCSLSTLRAFGELFAGAEGNVMAYGSPYGVGYPVVTAEIDV